VTSLSESATTETPDSPQPASSGLLAHVRARELGNRLGRRLTGTTFPEIQLLEDATPRDANFLHGQGTVALHFHPGANFDESNPEGRAEVALHEAFRDVREKLEVCKSTGVVAISNQTPGMQMKLRVHCRLSHRMLRDPGLQLARAMGLPTKSHGDRTVYDRLVIVMSEGRIERVFYPVTAGTVTQILGWLSHQP
jgi:peroxiredoxin